MLSLALHLLSVKRGKSKGLRIHAAIDRKLTNQKSLTTGQLLERSGKTEPLTNLEALWRYVRFDKTCTLVKVDFQFRDIRAKAATDTGDLAHSQTLLGHKNRNMTEHCVKARVGERMKPLR